MVAARRDLHNLEREQQHLKEQFEARNGRELELHHAEPRSIGS